ncbi:MAG: EAL domain-containing protein, partial [Thermoanaerobaculia bacterium]|nr:EAL domain-containing protein [Thermoanaerobaculia bacterium]
PPQLALVDLDVSGEPLELCRRLRAICRSDGCYILALARSETLDLLRGAFEAGVDDYLVKPVSLDALRLRLAIAERRSARRRQLATAETRLEHGERRYRTLIETMHEGLFQVDENGVIEFANSRLSRITGYTLDELVGQSAVELLVDPEVRERLPERRLLGIGTGSEEYSLPLLHKSGERIWTNLTAAPIVSPDGRPGSIGVVEDVTTERQAQEALSVREAYFRALSENTSDVVSILDQDGIVLYQSPSSARLLGWTPTELVGRNLVELVHENDRGDFTAGLERAFTTPEKTTSFQFRFPHRETGEWRLLEALCDNLLANPVVGGLLLTTRDVTERQRVTDALERQKAFFQQLFRNSPAGIVILDDADRIVDANRSFVELFQFSVDEIAGRPLSDFIVPERYLEEARELSGAVFNQRIIESETIRRRKDGTEVDVAILAYPIELGALRIGAYGIYTDITKRKQAERNLFHEAFHDALTGLPNRTLMTERLERALRRAQRGDYHFALMFIDLDRFKAINDSLGHAAGDELLQETARRLEASVRPGDTVARLGGDEFTVILEDLQEHADATRIAERILEDLARPFKVGGQEVTSSGSIGIASSFTPYEQVDDVIRDADVAMYRAKKSGKARYEIFDSAMHQNALEHQRQAADLRRALEQNQLLVYYQPVVSLTTGRLAGFEALVRWQHPAEGLLGPENLLPVAKENELSAQLGRWIFLRVCRQLAEWNRRLGARDGLQISVNVSAQELGHPDFLGTIWSSVREEGVRPAMLGFELTESSLTTAGKPMHEVLWKLKRRGFRLYLDDFGTGCSSIGALHSLPLDALKIDGSFISRLSAGNGGVDVVRAIAGLGENLGLSVVAEGVETEEQRLQLRKLGLPYAQGYFFSHPLPPEQAERLLEQDARW